MKQNLSQYQSDFGSSDLFRKMFFTLSGCATMDVTQTSLTVAAV